MNTTEAAIRIEMTYLRKMGYLCGWAWKNISWTFRGEPSGNIDVTICTGSDCDNFFMELDYKVKPHYESEEHWRPMKYRVTLVYTPCRFGGKRWWFICPNTLCGRRNSILYFSGDYFVCRKCACLKYESQEYSGKYTFLRNIFAAEDYESKMKRWFYRGLPTRKHRRLLKMTRGLTSMERMAACLAALKG